MPSDAVVATLAADARAARTPNAAPEPSASSTRRPSAGRSLRRSHLGLAAVVLVGAWLVLVFGSALSELNDATRRAAALAAEQATLESRLAASERELELVQTDAFQRLQARAHGLGRAGERAFALEPDAPAPPPVTPLGGASANQSRTPLESWLRLLFGDR
jgi:hypothetical protein